MTKAIVIQKTEMIVARMRHVRFAELTMARMRHFGRLSAGMSDLEEEP